MPKIECLIRRAGGSKVTLQAPEREYHFAPSIDNLDDPRHVADVSVAHHAKQLLRIKEGYQLAEGEAPADDGDDPILERVLKGSAVHNASYTIQGGDSIDLQDLVNMAFDDSGLDEDAWNGLSDQERYEFINTTLGELQNGVQNEDAPIIEHVGQSVNATERQIEADKGTPVVDQNTGDKAADETADSTKDADNDGINDELEDMTRKDLIPLYVERFGREPSARMKVEEIRRALSEEDE